MFNIENGTVTDWHIAVMLCIRDHKSYREMAQYLGKSLGTIQIRIGGLEEMGYVEKSSSKKARSRSLTASGKAYLKSLGYDEH